MNLFVPFILQTFSKNSESQSRVMKMCHFRAQNNPFVLDKFFLVQAIIITFIYLLAFFTVQHFKKFLQWIQSYGCATVGLKNPIYMPKIKSKSDINLLVKYWRLKNTKISMAESFLAIAWEPDFSQAVSLCRMLMNHKNFHFKRNFRQN